MKTGVRLKAWHLLLLSCLLLSSGYASAAIYQWTDAQGTVHFSDTPHPQAHSLSSQLMQQQNAQQKAHQKAEQEIKQEVEQEVEQDSQQDNQQVAQHPQVIMYSTSWCTYCKQARAYFRQHGISYTDYDVENDPAAAQRFQQLNGRGVPLIFVGNTRLDGWSAQHFDQVYYHDN